jgi:PAAR motif-containing protein
MGKPAAVVGSTATNETPPNQQPAVTEGGRRTVLSTVDNTGTISVGSSSVLIHGKSAARNGDKAKTWDYSTPPFPGVGKEVENAHVRASGSVIIGN